MRNVRIDSSELVNKQSEELKKLLDSSKRELFVLRFQKAVGELKNTSQVKLLKKKIARVCTELSKRARLVGERLDA